MPVIAAIQDSRKWTGRNAGPHEMPWGWASVPTHLDPESGVAPRFAGKGCGGDQNRTISWFGRTRVCAKKVGRHPGARRTGVYQLESEFALPVRLRIGIREWSRGTTDGLPLGGIASIPPLVIEESRS